jgi:hypothetical protein
VRLLRRFSFRQMKLVRVESHAAAWTSSETEMPGAPCKWFVGIRPTSDKARVTESLFMASQAAAKL